MSNYIELKDINKSYGPQKVIKNLNLEIVRGEFLVLLGPSGCGKTTILNILAGLISFDSGLILRNNIPINSLQPKDRNIGMVFQDHSLYPHMTVSKNLKFPLLMRKLNKNEIDRRLQEIIEIYKLHPMLDKFPYQLSGGEKQRVAICKALIQKPELFLFDEPLSNIDAKLRVSMRSEIKKIHKATKATFIYVTHDQIEALSLSDRIVVIKDGEILQSGDPKEIYNSPKSLFVAEFIGTPSINLIHFKVLQESNHYALVNDDFNIILKDNCYQFLNRYIDKEIIVGIRPEDIRIAQSDESAQLNEFNKNSFKVSVDIIENIGANLILHVFLKSTNLRIKTSKDFLCRSNDFFVNFAPQFLIFFEASMGMNIKSLPVENISQNTNTFGSE